MDRQSVHGISKNVRSTDSNQQKRDEAEEGYKKTEPSAKT